MLRISHPLRLVSAGTVAAAALLIVPGAMPAFAQAVTVPTETGSQFSLAPLLTYFLPHIVELAISLLMLVVGGIVTWLSPTIKAKFKVDIEARFKEIEARHRESLHSAIYTAVSGVIARHGNLATVDVGSDEFAQILRVIRESVPDAIDFFKPDDKVIARIATAKAGEIIARNTATITSTIGAGPALDDLVEQVRRALS